MSESKKQNIIDIPKSGPVGMLTINNVKFTFHLCSRWMAQSTSWLHTMSVVGLGVDYNGVTLNYNVHEYSDSHLITNEIFSGFLESLRLAGGFHV